MKDAVATMGSLLPDDAGGRDAVHVAVFSATSHERLFPAQAVAVTSHSEQDAEVSGTAEHQTVGIVDPFLKAPVPAGERFWVYLYPRTITALSHRWNHPAFEETATVYVPPSSKLASEEWLQNFCATVNCPGYHAVMGKVEEFIRNGGDQRGDREYLYFEGQDAHADIPPQFWDHVEVALGTKIEGERPSYFSCSC